VVERHFGKLLGRLMAARRFTEPELAALADVSVSTIAKAKRSRDSTWRRSTSTRVLRALASVERLSPQEEARYLELTGLRRLAAGARRLASSAPSERDEAEAAAIARLLVRQEGPAALEVMRSLARLAGMRPEDMGDAEAVAREHARTFTHVTPPQRTDLGVEQVITEYEVLEEDRGEEKRPSRRPRKKGGSE